MGWCGLGAEGMGEYLLAGEKVTHIYLPLQVQWVLSCKRGAQGAQPSEVGELPDGMTKGGFLEEAAFVQAS